MRRYEPYNRWTFCHIYWTGRPDIKKKIPEKKNAYKFVHRCIFSFPLFISTPDDQFTTSYVMNGALWSRVRDLYLWRQLWRTRPSRSPFQGPKITPKYTDRSGTAHRWRIPRFLWPNSRKTGILRCITWRVIVFLTYLVAFLSWRRKRLWNCDKTIVFITKEVKELFNVIIPSP